MSTMLRQLVRQVAVSGTGIAIVTELPGPLRDPATVAAARPDVVVVGVDDASEQAIADVLFASRAVRVLGVSSDAADATLYELRPLRVSLGELGIDALRAVIRHGAAGAR
jgi:hypothetical protein